MAAFKNEKEWNAWLAANPKAAARVQMSETSITSLRPVSTSSAPKLATSNGTSVVVKLPARTAPVNHYAAFVSKFDRAMAWVFVGAVATGSMGVVATVSAMLALEYLR